MPQITRLVAGKKNPSRVNIYVDGLFTLALSLDEVVKQGLSKGVELSPERIQSLKAFDDAEKVYAKVLNFLSFRPRSIKEVRDRLREYQVKDPDQQDSLINRLIDKGYLDDLAFARWFVNSRNSFRPRSALQLSAELAQKGISRDLIKMVITPEIDHSALRKLIHKKSALYDRPHLVAYLARHGFSYSKIRSELDEMGILA
ncbi:MAG: hypothetical protein ACD_65C00295G0002 [uncultured bacterium]|nr:MAG: hypothetical protein ACD_65C00295G0002 [uncultured bacterium]